MQDKTQPVPCLPRRLGKATCCLSATGLVAHRVERTETIRSIFNKGLATYCIQRRLLLRRMRQCVRSLVRRGCNMQKQAGGVFQNRILDNAMEPVARFTPS